MMSRQLFQTFRLSRFSMLLLLSVCLTLVVFAQPAHSFNQHTISKFPNQLSLLPIEKSELVNARGLAGLTKFQANSPPAGRPTLKALAHLPLCFETNVGQTDPSVNFLARGLGYTILITPREMMLHLAKDHTAAQPNPVFQKEHPPQQSSFRLKFSGANPETRAEGIAPLPGTINYFQGNDPARWRTNIPTFSKIRYRNLYPGIDLVYYGNQSQLEYHLLVTPGSDPGAITLEFEGDGRLSLDPAGNLRIQAAQDNIVFPKPAFYQKVGGLRQPVEGKYTLKTANRVGFALAGYDRKYPIIIDPALDFSTYFGGADGDSGQCVAVDAAGNTYITGKTGSADFPTLNPLQSGNANLFISKISADGQTLLFSTYLGGTGSEWVNGLAVDPAGNTYITGETMSLDFPTQHPLQPTNHGGEESDMASDAFVTKISADGQSLIFSTYLGGSGFDYATGIALDPANNIYLTGTTLSTDFPLKNPLQATNHGWLDVFITKISSNCRTLLFSSYLGGAESDYGNGIAPDPVGNVYLAGATMSSDFPIKHPLQPTNHNANNSAFATDAFIAKISVAEQSLVFSTYLGGSETDVASKIALDPTGNAYLTGWTESTDFPVVSPLQSNNRGYTDAFITKIRSDGAALLYSTYLGGSGADKSHGIALDPAGNAYLAGETESTDFPVANPLQSTNHGGYRGDAFITKISAAGQTLLCSTYLGGSGEDAALGITVDAAGNAYLTGQTSSADFPTMNALDATYHGNHYSDAFFCKIRTSRYD